MFDSENSFFYKSINIDPKEDSSDPKIDLMKDCADTINPLKDFTSENVVSKKIYGTTLYIEAIKLETYYGIVDCYVYQDIIDRKYIFALCSDLTKDILHTRVHSSCLTSETMLSLDCDCKDQLYGAVEKTISRGGIMFYLMQSGRGASLISKTRGCQLVQYNQDSITTFDAYKSLGLKTDYRDYRNVKDILIMMNLYQKQFILMTNNPTKIEKLVELGINIKEISHLQFHPNTFNKKYLLSKQETGHLLYYSKEAIKTEKTDYPSVKPFEPYHIPSCRRFIHCSSYYLPISPINNRLLIDKKDFVESEKIYDDIELVPDNKLFLKIKNEFKSKLRPYWFKCDVYYDVATQSENIVLGYGDPEKTPVVRFHSEFTFNRFPIKDRSYKDRYSKSIVSSIRNGSGLIIITNHNGDNSSIGKFLLQNNTVLPTGIDEKKDYITLIKLMKHHTKNSSIKLLYSENSRNDTLEALKNSNVKVIDQFCINTNDDKGHVMLQKRVMKSVSYLRTLDTVDPLNFNKDYRFWVTGIGSSMSHAKFFVHLCSKNNVQARFVDLLDTSRLELKDKDFLVVVSQGLSPHGSLPIKDKIEKHDCKNTILFTSVTKNNANFNKKTILEKFQIYGGIVINYPLEDEYTILIRTIGPLCGYFAIYKFLNFDTVDNFALIEKLTKSTIPDYDFIKCITDSSNLIVIIQDKIKEYSSNILNKLIEGGFLRTTLVVSETEFPHGFYQYCEHIKEESQTQRVNIIGFNISNKLSKFISNQFNYFGIETDIKGDLDILEIEHTIDRLVLNIIKQKNIDQKNYPGKDTQSEIYNI